LPVWGEQVLALGDLYPDQSGRGASFAFSVVGPGAATELVGDLLPVRFGDAPVGEGDAAPVVVDESARVGGGGVEVVGEGVQGVEERGAVVGVACPGGDLAVGVADRFGG
jgi:hypothetical protein